MKRICLTGIFAALVASMANAEPSADSTPSSSDPSGGLAVCIGCDDAALLNDLGQRLVVQALHADAKTVENLRKEILAKKRYGKVSVNTLEGDTLPYVDNLVNLLFVQGESTVSREELMRVLAPRGVLFFLSANGRRTDKVTKPVPKEIDDWTHFLHGPDNNALANDTVVGPPRHMQWLAAPMWTRHHDTDKGTYPSIRSVLSSEGRLFYMMDGTETSDMRVPSTWTLVARDAFSGVLLWEKPIHATKYDRNLVYLWRSMVADANHLYVSLGTDLPLSAIDPATGKTVRGYQGTENFRELITAAGRLFVVDESGAILALDAATGKRLWNWTPSGEEIVPLTLAVSGGKVFVKTDKHVRCFAIDGGKQLWQFSPPDSQQKRTTLKWPRERLIVAEGVVLYSYGGNDPQCLNRDAVAFLGSHPQVHAYDGKLGALSAEDGKPLWNCTYYPGLESMPGEIYVREGVVWPGPAFTEPRDLRTGELLRDRGDLLERVWTDGHHYRCYPGKATTNYAITAKRGIELLDFDGDNHSRNNWVRATCRVGVTPCNGLIYSPPHSCGCYMEAKLYGFYALAAKRLNVSPKAFEDKKERLQKGPAFGTTPTAKPATNDWPTYRGNAARSGSTQSDVSKNLKQGWKTELGGRLSPVTVADGTVFVAQVDAHTVHALDAKDGAPLWHFTAGARVDSPPTFHNGIVLFGSRDGCVYCVRASDGKLVWQFHVAPEPRNAVAYEQLESLWPVSGSVLVENGVAYVAAGRSSYMDNGILLYGLDPVTGKLLAKHHIVSEHVGATPPPDDAASKKSKIAQNWLDYKTFLAPDRSDSFSMRGALTDILAAEGDAIFMRHMQFDDKLARQQTVRPHLFSTSDLLDGSEHHRSYWVLGTGDFNRTPVAFPWILSKKIAVPFGLMMSFDDKNVWCVRRAGKRRGKSPVKAEPPYSIVSMQRPDPTDAGNAVPDFRARDGKKPTDVAWQSSLPLRPRAMVRAGDLLLIGGTDGKTGVLQTISAEAGKMLRQTILPSSPVWDGLAAAGGSLYVSCEDGTVRCLRGESL